MRTFRRPASLRGFSLMDAVVGVLLLSLVGVLLASAWPTLGGLGARVGDRAQALARGLDAASLESHF